jgi:hypothetical protein
MKKIILYAAIFMMTESLFEARGGGGGFHGGGGGHMGGSHGGASRGGSGSRSRSSSRTSSSSRSRSGSRSSSASRNRSGSRNGNTYNHTNNFYGGRGGYGYGGWGAWGAFGFTALATTGIILAASSAGNGNSAQIQQALNDTQVEMGQLQQRLDALENQGDQTPDAPANEQSPFNDPKAIKAYMEQLKKAQTDLKAAQVQQKNSSDDTTADDATVEQPKKAESTEKNIETLQDRLNSLKAQLYDYWHGTDSSAA